MPTNTYFRNSKEDLEYNTITGEYTNVATAVIATRDSATDTYYTKKLN